LFCSFDADWFHSESESREHDVVTLLSHSSGSLVLGLLAKAQGGHTADGAHAAARRPDHDVHRRGDPEGVVVQRSIAVVGGGGVVGVTVGGAVDPHTACDEPGKHEAVDQTLQWVHLALLLLPLLLLLAATLDHAEKILGSSK